MGNLLDRFRNSKSQSSGAAAKERLQLVLASDRSHIPPEQLLAIKDEIIAVISKYVNIVEDKVEIRVEQRQLDSWLVAGIPLVRSTEQAVTGVDDA